MRARQRIAVCSLVGLLACGHGHDNSTTDTADNPDTHITSATVPATSADPTETTPESICAPLCAKLDECGLGDAFADCPCLVGAMDGWRCAPAWELTAGCFASASCEELADPNSRCWTNFLQVNDLCGPGGDGCETFLRAEDPAEGTCTFDAECLGESYKSMNCSPTHCACAVANKTVAYCSSQDVCENFADALSSIIDCCTGPI